MNVITDGTLGCNDWEKTEIKLWRKPENTRHGLGL